MASSSYLTSYDVSQSFKTRFDDRITLIKQYYYSLYQRRDDADEYFEKLIELMVTAYNERKEELRILDASRENDPAWFLSNQQVAIMLYVNLYADNLDDFSKHIDYLIELGITYIHLMPIFAMPEENNDGGYAVSSYLELDPRIGTMVQLEQVVDKLRQNNVSVCLDFILNHTSDGHRWAQSAIEGDPVYQEMYYLFDKGDPYIEQYKRTTPEVFPRIAPGHFTWNETMKKFVMTSFFDFQWDLNYHNPRVLNHLLISLLYLANRGIDIFRLDAIPYIWKSLGTTSRNLPQVHTITRLMRLVIEAVAPAVLLKGEAIVAPKDILPYFGDTTAGECQVMYNASYMVLIWNTLATKDVNLMRLSLLKYPTLPKHTTWLNYVRCHDDIGWGFDEDSLRELGLDPFLHKQFIINFYKGNFDYSFSRGELYEFDNITLDARISGTMASLAGLEKAIDEKDEYQLELSIKRILLINSMILSFPGIPLLYSGDEIGQLNDYNYTTIETKSSDSRWLHRPKFDRSKLSEINNLGTVTGKIYTGIKRLIDTRKSQVILSSDLKTTVFDTGNSSVFGFYKHTKIGKLIVLHNFVDFPVEVPSSYLKQGYFGGIFTDMIQGKSVSLHGESVLLGPYEFLWLFQS